jgi:DNA invertase Pin-like site-specific DNA recombinase
VSRTFRGLTRDDIDEIIAYRCDRVAQSSREGMTGEDIAARLGVTRRSVQRYRVRAGVSGPAPIPLTPQQIARAAQLLDDGCSICETARTIGCSEGTIARRFPGRGWTKEQVRAHISEVRRLKHALAKKLLQQGISA